jgi:hypothetical protein
LGLIVFVSWVLVTVVAWNKSSHLDWNRRLRRENSLDSLFVFAVLAGTSRGKVVNAGTSVRFNVPTSVWRYLTTAMVRGVAHVPDWLRFAAHVIENCYEDDVLEHIGVVAGVECVTVTQYHEARPEATTSVLSHEPPEATAFVRRAPAPIRIINEQL